MPHIEFRKLNLPIKRQARGLGAQLQFGRQHSTAIIRQRIETFQPLWNRLRQSVSPYRIKVMAIKQAAWSGCLHGIAATWISHDTFVALRTQAMKGINAFGAGCNSNVHLGLVEHPLLDPYFWAIVSTVRTLRECSSKEQLNALLQRPCVGHPNCPRQV